MAVGNEANLLAIGDGPDDGQPTDGPRDTRWIDWLLALLVIIVAVLGYLFFRPR